jgi:hypothetical protein
MHPSALRRAIDHKNAAPYYLFLGEIERTEQPAANGPPVPVEEAPEAEIEMSEERIVIEALVSDMLSTDDLAERVVQILGEKGITFTQNEPAVPDDGMTDDDLLKIITETRLTWAAEGEE